MKSKDLSDMTINPLATPPGKFLWEVYPQIARRPVLNKPPEDLGWLPSDWDKLVRFMIIFADPESPLAGETDYDYRKGAAIESVKPKGRVLDEIKSEGVAFHAVLLDVFKLVNSYQYEMWLSMKMNFHILTAELRKAPDSLDASSLNARRMLAGSIEEIAASLLKIEASLFPNKRIEKIINASALVDEVGGWAEEFAEEPAWKDELGLQEEI